LDMGRKVKEEAAAAPEAAPRAPPPSSTEIKALAKETHFDEHEVSQLAERFHALDHDGSGTLSTDELCEMTELAMYPLLKRVLAMHNDSKTGVITFAEFCHTMSMLSGKATLGEKLKFAFNVFDVDQTGTIHSGELFTVFRLLTGKMHDDRDLQQIVDSYL
jgi:Ca2+-binding EF-hand superfamily protein